MIGHANLQPSSSNVEIVGSPIHLTPSNDRPRREPQSVPAECSSQQSAGALEHCKAFWSYHAITQQGPERDRERERENSYLMRLFVDP